MTSRTVTVTGGTLVEDKPTVRGWDIAAHRTFRRRPVGKGGFLCHIDTWVEGFLPGLGGIAPEGEARAVPPSEPNAEHRAKIAVHDSGARGAGRTHLPLGGRDS